MVPANGPLDNRDVNDVIVISLGRQGPDRTGLALGELLYLTALQQARQVCLWPAPPSLG